MACRSLVPPCSSASQLGSFAQCLKDWNGCPLSFWRIIGPWARALTRVVANQSRALISQSWNGTEVPSHSGGWPPPEPLWPPPRSSSLSSSSRRLPRRSVLRRLSFSRIQARNSSLSKPSSSSRWDANSSPGAPPWASSPSSKVPCDDGIDAMKGHWSV